MQSHRGTDNRRFEWRGHQYLTAVPTLPPCLPLKGSVRQNLDDYRGTEDALEGPQGRRNLCRCLLPSGYGRRSRRCRLAPTSAICASLSGIRGDDERRNPQTSGPAAPTPGRWTSGPRGERSAGVKDELSP